MLKKVHCLSSISGKTIQEGLQQKEEKRRKKKRKGNRKKLLIIKDIIKIRIKISTPNKNI
jgi:hypothetical protein